MDKIIERYCPNSQKKSVVLITTSDLSKIDLAVLGRLSALNLSDIERLPENFSFPKKK